MAEPSNEAFSLRRNEDGVLIGPGPLRRRTVPATWEPAASTMTQPRRNWVSAEVPSPVPCTWSSFRRYWSRRSARNGCRKGGLSLYFKYATTDSEPVQAFARKPEGNRTEVWMDDANGNRVADGTASASVRIPTRRCRQRMAAMPAPEDLRILKNVRAGDAGERLPTRISQEAQALANRLAVDYRTASGLHGSELSIGERIATPALQVQVAAGRRTQHVAPQRGLSASGSLVPSSCSCTVTPVFVEHDYECQCTGACGRGNAENGVPLLRSQSLHEPGSDDRVLTMIMMTRFMKASSTALGLRFEDTCTFPGRGARRRRGRSACRACDPR